MKKRLLICFDIRELYNAKEKNCLEKLTDAIDSFLKKGHIVVVVPFSNKYSLKHKLEDIFLFTEEQSKQILKNSEVFYDVLGIFSNLLNHIPNAMKKFKISSDRVIIVENWAKKITDSEAKGYLGLLVPHKGSPIYHKYINRLITLVNSHD